MKRLTAGVLAALCLFLSSCGSETKHPTTSHTPSGSTSATSSDELPSFIDDEIDDSHNLARKATATADSVSDEYPTYTADLLNDGDLLTRWLSGRAGTEEEPSSFGLCWEESVTFDTLMIHWEAAHPTEDGFLVLTDAEEEIPYRVVRRDTAQEDGQTDVVLFDSPVTVTDLRIVCTKPYYSETYHREKTYPSCYELKVYNGVELTADGDASAVNE